MKWEVKLYVGGTVLMKKLEQLICKMQKQQHLQEIQQQD